MNGEMVTCPVCGGTGVVFRDDADGNPAGGTCGRCSGTGQVPA